MQNGKIGVTTENIFPVIKKFLYSDQEIFLRELISNSVDATQKLKTLSSTGEFKGELGDLTIRVKLDPDKRVLTVSDEGIGMTAEEIDKYIPEKDMVYNRPKYHGQEVVKGALRYIYAEDGSCKYQPKSMADYDKDHGRV